MSTLNKGLFNKGLCGSENFEVVCSLQQVSLSEYINNDIWGGGTLEYLKIVAYLFFLPLQVFVGRSRSSACHSLSTAEVVVTKPNQTKVQSYI